MYNVRYIKYYVLNSACFILFTALLVRWLVYSMTTSSVSCLSTLRMCIKGQQHYTTSSVLWVLPAKAYTGQRFLLFIVNDENWWKLETTCNVQTDIMKYTDNAVSFDCLLNIYSRCSALKRMKIHVWSLIKSCVLMWSSEIDLTLSSLETLAKVFDHPSCSLTHTKAQVQ